MTDRGEEKAPRRPIPRRTDKQGHRYRLWPIALGFARRTSPRTFDRHGWQLSDGTFGQTLHFGPLKVYLGPVALTVREGRQVMPMTGTPNLRDLLALGIATSTDGRMALVRDAHHMEATELIAAIPAKQRDLIEAALANRQDVRDGLALAELIEALDPGSDLHLTGLHRSLRVVVYGPSPTYGTGTTIEAAARAARAALLDDSDD